MRERIAWQLLLVLVSGCATTAGPQRGEFQHAIPLVQGSYHQVRSGETLWGIAHAFGIDVQTLTSVNGLSDATQLAVGQRLFVPLPSQTTHFLWPVRGSLGRARTSRGLAISAPSGSVVRASRAGYVVVAARHLSGWGQTLVLDHLDGYLTVYAGMGQLLVQAGSHVLQGMPVGTMAERPLHFEIRLGVTPKNTLALLPEP